jgi:two-component system, NarL family, sensor kinase
LTKQILYLFCFLLVLSCQNKTQNSDNQEVFNSDNVIQQVEDLMDAGEYENAIIKIGDIYQKYPLLSYPLTRYYLLCFESEILYYNAIYSLGADKANEALLLAQNMKYNDTLIGNAYNLRGINYEYFQTQDLVLSDFVQAEKYLKQHNNKRLSRRYHVLSNLGQSYAKKNSMDSAIKYLNESNQLCESKGVNRTLSINYLALSKLYLENKQPTKALNCFDSAVLNSKLNPQEDIQLFCLIQKARLLIEMNHHAESVKLIDSAFSNIVEKKEYNMGVNDFFINAVEILKDIKAYELANKILFENNLLKRTKINQEMQIKERFIQLFYKNQELIRYNEEFNKRAIDKIKIKNNTIAFLVVVLLGLMILSLVWFFYVRQRRELDKSKARVDAILFERDRISKEFHDGISPNLSTIKLIGEAIKSNINNRQVIDQLPILVDDTINEIRSLINELSPSYIVEYGLSFALNKFKENLSKNAIVPLQIHSKIEDKRYSTDIEINVYRIIQEAVNNAIKHADALWIKVELEESRHSLFVTISDSGNASGTNASPMKSNHGILNMNSRAKIINARINTDINPQKGTQIKIVVPL